LLFSTIRNRKQFKELYQALDSGAPASELLSIIYSKRLYSLLVDYENSGNNSAANSYAALLKELQRITNLYNDQWLLFYNGTADVIGVGDMLNCLKLLDELLLRIKDKNDSLDNLQKFETIFKLPGASFTILNKARKFVHRLKYERAEKLLLLLLQSPENKDGFSLGGAYHFLGKVQYYHYSDRTNAYKSFLKVHNLPACLVYTAHSYMNIANILNDWRLKDQALAVLAVDVPNIDFESIKAFRHLIATDICLNKYDYREAVRHLQVTDVLMPGCYTNNRAFQLKRCPNGGTQLWQSVISEPWSEEDEWNTILKSTENTENVPEYNLFLDLVLHDWPVMDEIPLNIATNRLLNNNIFEQKRKTLTTNSE